MEDEFALPHNLKTDKTYPHFWSAWTKQMEAAPLTAKVCLLGHTLCKALWRLVAFIDDPGPTGL